MPRPKKTGFAYFSLDTDYFSNKKTKALRRAHGTIGILTYINLLCKVYATKGYYYEFNDIDELSHDIAEEITNVQIERTATCVTETINYLVGRGILNEGLFKQGIISGEALQEQYVISAYKAKRKIEMDVYCLVDVLEIVRKIRVSSEETPISSEETPVISEESTQSKVNKNKDITTTTTTDYSSLSLSAHAREEENGSEPSFIEVYNCFTEENGMPHDQETMDEVRAFRTYNKSRGWDCMPQWRNAVELWILRKYRVKPDRR